MNKKSISASAVDGEKNLPDPSYNFGLVLCKDHPVIAKNEGDIYKKQGSSVLDDPGFLPILGLCY